MILKDNFTILIKTEILGVLEPFTQNSPFGSHKLVCLPINFSMCKHFLDVRVFHVLTGAVSL